MINNDKTKITAPVSIEDVRQVLVASSRDLGTLCKHLNINIWSRYKPIIYTNGVKMIWGTKHSTYTNVWNEECTSISPVFGNEGSGANRIAPISVRISDGTLADLIDGITTDTPTTKSVYQWKYNQPSGGMSSPYRLSDFASYNHDAQKPFVCGVGINANYADNGYIKAVWRNINEDYDNVADDILQAKREGRYAISEMHYAITPTDANGDKVNSWSFQNIALGLAVYNQRTREWLIGTKSVGSNNSTEVKFDFSSMGTLVATSGDSTKNISCAVNDGIVAFPFLVSSSSGYADIVTNDVSLINGVMAIYTKGEEPTRRDVVSNNVSYLIEFSNLSVTSTDIEFEYLDAWDSRRFPEDEVSEIFFVENGKIYRCIEISDIPTVTAQWTSQGYKVTQSGRSGYNIGNAYQSSLKVYGDCVPTQISKTDILNANQSNKVLTNSNASYKFFWSVADAQAYINGTSDKGEIIIGLPKFDEVLENGEWVSVDGDIYAEFRTTSDYTKSGTWQTTESIY